MPTVIGHHNVKDKKHWLASPKREEFFGALGVTNIRTFVDPQNRSRAAVLSSPASPRNSGPMCAHCQDAIAISPSQPACSRAS